MKLLRFVAVDLPQALLRVRAELSERAVILEIRLVTEGIEVLAALDYDLAVSQRIDQSARLASDLPSPINALHGPEAFQQALGTIQQQSAEIASLRGEVQALRQLIERQAGTGAGGLPGMAETALTAYQLLSQMGFEQKLASELLSDLPANASALDYEETALQRLTERILVLPPELLTAHPGERQVIALVGPTGTGKTTTILKLAAGHLRKFGPESVALVAAGNKRHDAWARLRDFGAENGVAVHSAGDSETLQALLLQLQPCSLVLIDAPGVNPRDQQLGGQPALLCPLANQMKVFLVLAANGQADAYRRIIARFRSVPLAGVMLTKLDETTSLGTVLSALIEHELGIALVSNGQRVPRDLHHMGSDELLDRSLALCRRAQKAGHDLATGLGHDAKKTGDTGHVPV